MKRLVFFLVTALTLFSCSNEIPEQEVPTYRGRTIMAYLVANNKNVNLDKYLKQNVVWMYQSMTEMKDSCRLLVFYRPNTGDSLLTEPSILEFLSDGKGNVNGQPGLVVADLTDKEKQEQVFQSARLLKSYTQAEGLNATDPQVMAQVFTDMRIAAPSGNYGLIFGSHATGWMPAAKTVGRAFGDDNGYSIDIPELHDVLASSFGSSGKLDFILFDACMMGSVEVAYELRDVTDYCVASVMETPVYGFPYHLMFDCLVREPVDYRRICTVFTEYYLAQSTQKETFWGTCAAVDCSKLDGLSVAVAGELANHADSLATVDYGAVQQYGANSFRNFSYDVKDFFSVLGGGTVSASLQNALDEAVVAKSCIPGSTSFYISIDDSRFCGIGMYIPGRSRAEGWDEYYRNSISWYQAVGWETVVNN